MIDRDSLKEILLRELRSAAAAQIAKRAYKENRPVLEVALDRAFLKTALIDSFRRLTPRYQWRNPVMFIVEIGSVFTTVLAIAQPTVFAWVTTIWLWLTVLFANLAEIDHGDVEAARFEKSRSPDEHAGGGRLVRYLK